MVIRFCVLGALTVHRDETAVDLQALMLRRLLAVLLSRAGQPIGPEELTEAMWDGDPPATARKTMQVYVHRLRRVLQDPDRLSLGAAGYRLQVGPDELDASVFADLVRRARAARRDLQLNLADDLYRQALSLWHGEPYADVSTVGFLADEVQRLTEQHLQAREEYLAVGLDLGRSKELVMELTSLTVLHPYRETARAYLMLALYRCGRQAEALEVFRDTRALLADELGVEPGALLQRLHAAMLRGEDQLSRLTIEELTEASPRPATVASSDKVIPAQLPADNATFTGRADDLSNLERLLPKASSTPSTVVISAIAGAAGIGKTTLAVHWAHRLAERFPDGQLYVNLQGFSPSGSIMPAAEALRLFLEALGVPTERIPADVPGQVGLYRSVLAGRRMLIVLDNARHADHVRPLLPATAGCLAIVTSRNPLSGLVATDGAHPLILDTLPVGEGRKLLERRLGPARVAAEPQAVQAILVSCAGLPLALAIVAARAAINPSATLGTLADQLSDSRLRLDVLTGEEDAATDIRAVFSWSYDALSPVAARMFRLLGLNFGPDISVAAAASLAAREVATTQELLDELVQAHLLGELASGRYAFHDLLRVYAAELAGTHESEAERLAAKTRLLDHFLHSGAGGALLLQPGRAPLEVAEPAAGTTVTKLLDQPSTLEWFEAEHAAFLIAISQTMSDDRPDYSWRLAWCVADFYQRRGRWQDRIDTQLIALEAGQRLGDYRAQQFAYRALSRTYSRTGRFAEGYEALRLAMTTCDPSDLRGLASLHHGYCELLGREDRFAEALVHAEAALALYGEAGDRLSEARAHNGMGWFSAKLGEFRQALVHCRHAVEVFRELGDELGEAHTLDSIGYAHFQLGELALAIDCYQQSLRLYRNENDPYNEADTMISLGDVQLAVGDRAEATATWQQALSILDGLGHADAERVRAKLAS